MAKQLLAVKYVSKQKNSVLNFSMSSLIKDRKERNVYRCKEDGVLISKEDREDLKFLGVKQLSKSGVLNLYKMLKGDEYYSVWEESGDVLILPATEEERKKCHRIIHGCASGRTQVTSYGMNVYIVKKDMSLMLGHALSATVHQDKKCYIEVHLNKTCDLPFYSELTEQQKMAPQFSYRMRERNYEAISNFSFSNKIAKNFGIRKNVTLNTWWKDDNTFIIEGQALVCDICGKSVSRYSDEVNELYVCEECGHSIDRLRHFIGKTKITDFNRINKKLDNLVERMTALITEDMNK